MARIILSAAQAKAKRHAYYLAHRKLKGRKKGTKTKKSRSTKAQIKMRKGLRLKMRTTFKAARKMFSGSLKAEVVKRREALTAELKATSKADVKQKRIEISARRKQLTVEVKARRKAQSTKFKADYKAESKKINNIK